jgi:hypothetical protein
VFGHHSLSQIHKGGGKVKGSGFAVAGLVLGYLGLLFLPAVIALKLFTSYH